MRSAGRSSLFLQAEALLRASTSFRYSASLLLLLPRFFTARGGSITRLPGGPELGAAFEDRPWAEIPLMSRRCLFGIRRGSCRRRDGPRCLWLRRRSELRRLSLELLLPVALRSAANGRRVGFRRRRFLSSRRLSFFLAPAPLPVTLGLSIAGLPVRSFPNVRSGAPGAAVSFAGVRGPHGPSHFVFALRWKAKENRNEIIVE